MKKFLNIVMCFLIMVPCVFLLAACGGKNKLKEADWQSVGLTSETIVLPELKVKEIVRKNDAEEIGVSIFWKNATEQDFDALVSECFEKIPANKTIDGKDVETVGDLIEQQSGVKMFNASYEVEEQKYFCSIYFSFELPEEEEVSVELNELVLKFQKENRVNMSHNFWDLDSDDTTWFSEEELEFFGLEGLQMSEGTVIGKLVNSYENRQDIGVALEGVSEQGFRDFALKLYTDYNVNLRFFGYEPVPIEDLFSTDDITDFFSAKYETEDKKGDVFMTYGSDHILIHIIVEAYNLQTA